MWKKKIYIKNNISPFPLSRTKIDLFLECRKCFYNEMVKGVRRPHGPPMALNNAIVFVIKNDLEKQKNIKKRHSIFDFVEKEISFADHPKLGDWKNIFKGIRFVHKNTNFELFGAIDDLWFNKNDNTYSVVLIKASSKKEKVTLDNVPKSYWRQLSFYNYLLKMNGIKASNKGFIVYNNAQKNSEKFQSKLFFETDVFCNILDCEWIEEILDEIYKILQDNNHPPPSKNCKFCEYVNLTNLSK